MMKTETGNSQSLEPSLDRGKKKLINKQNFQEPESVMSELHRPKIHVLKSQPLVLYPYLQIRSLRR